MTDRRFTVALIVGSVSEPSLNRRLANALVGLSPDAGLSLVDVEIGHLPFFRAQYQSEDEYPDVGRGLKSGVDSADGLLIVTPEYNRSIPGVLKNAIDWASRPYGKNSFNGKPTAAIGASGGAIGTALAQQHLRQILGAQGVLLMGGETYITFKQGLIADDGTVTDESTRGFLKSFLDQFAALVARFAAPVRAAA